MSCFEKNILGIYKDKGREWLTNLPITVENIANQYNLSDLKPLGNLSYNYVLSGFQTTKPIILKLGLDINALKQEATTLKIFAGFGVIQVLAADDGRLLLERAIPGISLKSYFPSKDSNSIKIACDVMNRLHQAPIPKNVKLPHVKNWLSVFDTDISHNEQVNCYLQKARDIRDQLLETSAAPVLLHGDLHHENILQNGTSWVIIDPKSVIGEATYEVTAFIRNPIPELLGSKNVNEIIQKRITAFSTTLKLNPKRIKDWCFVQSVLAGIWALEDHQDETYFRYLTEIFNK